MAKVQVRVSMFPEPIEVDEDEIPGLRSQGLLVEDEPAGSEPGGTPAATSRRPRSTTPNVTGSQET